MCKPLVMSDADKGAGEIAVAASHATDTVDGRQGFLVELVVERQFHLEVADPM